MSNRRGGVHLIEEGRLFQILADKRARGGANSRIYSNERTWQRTMDLISNDFAQVFSR